MHLFRDQDTKPPSLSTVFFLLVVVCASWLLRLDTLNNDLLEFAPVREYRSALIASGIYTRYLKDSLAWENRVADSSIRRTPLEPPINEFITAVAYKATGGVTLLIPRLISLACWSVSALLLFLIVRRFGSDLAAVVSAGLLMGHPFSVAASVSFQPDHLMLMFYLFSVLAMINFFASPSKASFLPLFVGSFAAASIKIHSIILLGIPFGVMALYSFGFFRSVQNKYVYYYLLALVLTVIGYLLWWQILKKSLDSSFFFPSLLIRDFFWAGWATNISGAVGYFYLLAGVVGSFCIQRPQLRVLTIGLWMGYLIYGIFFTYTIYTHMYYQLPVLLISTLGVGALLARLTSEFGHGLKSVRLGKTLAISVLLLVALKGFIVERELFRSPVLLTRGEMESIGELVQHTVNAVWLADHYGAPLRYHASIGGVGLPGKSRAQILDRKPTSNRLDALDERIMSYAPDYFIVTDMQAWALEPELELEVRKRYTLLAETGRYLVFDLRAKPG